MKYTDLVCLIGHFNLQWYTYLLTK